MTWLLDTNVLSETTRPRPNNSVIEWIESRAPSDLYLSVLTVGELIRGARKLKESNRRIQLERLIEQDLSRQFEGRVLVYDYTAAMIWGQLMGDGDRHGQTPSAADAQIAALAIRHQMILVTRNEKDFLRFENLKLLNPWRTQDNNHH